MEYLLAMQGMERKLLDDMACRKYVDGLIQKDEILGSFDQSTDKNCL